jgi:hypothetical protein
MKTLKEHQVAAYASHYIYTRIECPDCGLELTGDRNLVLACNPPHTWVICSNGHKRTVALPLEWHSYPETCAHGAPIGTCSIC